MSTSPFFKVTLRPLKTFEVIFEGEIVATVRMKSEWQGMAELVGPTTGSPDFMIVNRASPITQVIADVLHDGEEQAEVFKCSQRVADRIKAIYELKKTDRERAAAAGGPAQSKSEGGAK
jgi:hypothetical protein